MRTYARLDNGIIVEIITPPLNLEGNQYAIEQCFPAEFVATMVEITGLDPLPDQGWTYDGSVFALPLPPVIPDSQLAFSARQQRDWIMLNVYDIGISMALRALRMASSDAEKEYASSKISELDNFAEALLAIPDQAGFPRVITWPVTPTK